MSQTASSPTKAERKAAAREARLERERAEAAKAHRRRRLLQLGGLLGIAAVIVVIAIVASSGGGGTKTASSGGAVAGGAESSSMLAGIPQKGAVLGNPNAPVTLVEFADPQCPFCKEYTLNSMPKVVQDYVRSGKVKMELRLMSFIGPDSVKAAQALEAAGLQNKLWNATDVLYYNQGRENSGYVTDSFLRSVLGAVPGLNVNQALAQAKDPRVTQAMNQTDTLANRYGVDSTPTFLVGKSGGALKKVNVQSLSASEIEQAIQQASK